MVPLNKHHGSLRDQRSIKHVTLIRVSVADRQLSHIREFLTELSVEFCLSDSDAVNKEPDELGPNREKNAESKMPD